MRVPRSMSLLLLSCISTIRFPFTRPSLIMTLVLIMLSTSFCAVPLFMRVLPVTNSGPTTTTIGCFAVVANGLSGLQVIPPVRMPLVLHISSAATT